MKISLKKITYILIFSLSILLNFIYLYHIISKNIIIGVPVKDQVTDDISIYGRSYKLGDLEVLENNRMNEKKISTLRVIFGSKVEISTKINNFGNVRFVATGGDGKPFVALEQRTPDIYELIVSTKGFLSKNTTLILSSTGVVIKPSS